MANVSRSKRDVLTVFIGSPGDLQEERREARRVVDRLNNNIARNLDLYIELRGWEDTLPGSGRPQGRINEDLRDSDLFVGLVWRRWGTPTGEYTSGFEEEYELAKKQREKGELEEIWLFFKKVPDDMLGDPGDQLRRVLAFKEAITAQREIFYKSFESTEDWRDMLYDYLGNYLTRQARSQEVGQTGTVSEGEQTILEEEGDENDLVRSLNALSDAVLEDRITEVDSFRSVRAYLTSSALLYLQRHDTHLMGTHENQLLYRYRRRAHLIPAEEAYVLRNLAVDNGVEAGWVWISRTSTALVDTLLYIGLLDSLDMVKMGVLRLVSRIDVNLEFARIKSIIDQSNSLVAATALEVYGQHAPRSGVVVLEEYVEHESSDVAEAAWQAVLAILARHDPEQAIDWLGKPTPLRRRNVTKLMAPVWSSTSKESVRVLLEDESPLIRREAFEVVKDELSEDDIRKFTADEDVLMRAAAYMELVRSGVRVDEQELVDSLDGLNNRQPTQRTVDTTRTTSPPAYTLNDILLELYKKLSRENLEQGITWFSTRGELKYEALADSYFEEFKETLRNDISQAFERLKDQFYAESQVLVSRAPEGERDALKIELIDEWHKLDDFCFERFQRAAYRALAKHAEPSDIPFVRSLLSNLRSKYFREELVQAAIEILTKHGAAEDVELLKPLLSETYPKVKTVGAELTLQLAPINHSENVQYMLDMDDPDVTRGVLRYSLESQDALSPDVARNLLFNAKEQVRLDALAFLAHKLSREELESLLDEYPTIQNFYYYDVVSWLDRFLYASGNLSDDYTAELKQRLLNAGAQST